MITMTSVGSSRRVAVIRYGKSTGNHFKREGRAWAVHSLTLILIGDDREERGCPNQVQMSHRRV